MAPAGSSIISYMMLDSLPTNACKPTIWPLFQAPEKALFPLYPSNESPSLLGPSSRFALPSEQDVQADAPLSEPSRPMLLQDTTFKLSVQTCVLSGPHAATLSLTNGRLQNFASMPAVCGLVSKLRRCIGVCRLDWCVYSKQATASAHPHCCRELVVSYEYRPSVECGALGNASFNAKDCKSPNAV